MNHSIYVAGAASRAQTTREYLEALNTGLAVSAFLVSPEMSDCGQTIGGIAVLPISEEAQLDIQNSVYIATRGVNQRKIESELKSVGFREIIPITPELDTSLRNQYVKAIFAAQHRPFIKIDDLGTDRRGKKTPSGMAHLKTTPCQPDFSNGVKITVSVYVVSTAGAAKPETPYAFIPEERIIQAGAALTEKRISNAVYDNYGDNISKKNRQFCELTALYWLWKHAKDDYLGLVHYRRHFILPNDWLTRMKENNIDVLLPVPLYVAPSLEDNFKMRHVPMVWNAMLDSLRQIHPEDYDFIHSYLKTSGLYSPCNMFVMKNQILQDYCEWLFPILFSVESKVGQLEDAYQNRYPGFLSERLMTAYFAMQETKYRIVYADKNFLK